MEIEKEDYGITRKPERYQKGKEEFKTEKRRKKYCRIVALHLLEIYENKSKK